VTLVLVPIVHGTRTAAILGAGTAPGPDGILRGDWLIVNLPTLLLELLAIGVWLLLVTDRPATELRAKWPALLPLAIVPAFAALFAARPLAGFIVSATISWGANLAVFVPVWASLNLAMAAFACYLSTLALAKPAGNRGPWELFLLGTAAVVLAGFFTSMASVEGLALGLVAIGTAFSERSSAQTTARPGGATPDVRL